MSQPIVIVSGSSPPLKCGVGDFSSRLGIELVQSGRDVIVVTSRGASSNDLGGMHVWPVVDSWNPSALRRVLRVIRDADPYCINLHYPTQEYGRLSLIDLLPLGMHLPPKVPVVTTIHEYVTYSSLGRRRVQLLARASDAIIVPAEENMTALGLASPRLMPRMHHVPLAPAIEPQLPAGFDRDIWRAEHGADRNTFVLVFVGFISPSKGLDTLLDAIDGLPEQYDIRLWLLADHEAEHARYAAYHAHIAYKVARLAQPWRVQWLGHQPGGILSRFLTAGDIAALPYTDGASLRRTSLLTALAHGLPAISTGEHAPCTGIDVVPIGDPVALRATILKYALDPARLADLSNGARDAMRASSWPAIARATLAVFDAVGGSA